MSERSQLGIPALCRSLITAASLFLPFSLRSDWKREWLAELHSRCLIIWRWHPGLAAQAGLLFRCFGAFRDAACLGWDHSSACVIPKLSSLAPSSAFRRSVGLFTYAFSVVVFQSLRPLLSHTVGRISERCGQLFWLGELIVFLTSFLLVCSFFRRVCQHERIMWSFVRLVLVLVFVLLFVLSASVSHFAASNGHRQLLSKFLLEFEQNLYFAVLVLNTLLYLFMQQLETTDDQLSLLVCGLGIQFAGPAAAFALAHITAAAYTRWVATYTPVLCSLFMMLTWCYALTRGKTHSKTHV